MTDAVETILTQERLKELLEYNGENGKFTWKANYGSAAKSGNIAGYVNKLGYVMIGVGGKRYLAHRLVWLYVNGYFPKECIDHINGDKSDNRIHNLREATKSENEYNKKVHTNSKSGVKGVYWNKINKKWVADIRANGKYFYIGSFETLKEASKAIKIKREELHKEFANHG